MTTSRGTVGAGIAACVAGGALAVAAFLQPEKMNAPAWVVYAAALAFILAGALLVARARGYARLQAWLPVALLAFALVGIALAFVANGKWVAIQGPGALQAVSADTLWLGVDEELWVLDAQGHRTARRCARSTWRSPPTATSPRPRAAATR